MRYDDGFWTPGALSPALPVEKEREADRELSAGVGEAGYTSAAVPPAPAVTPSSGVRYIPNIKALGTSSDNAFSRTTQTIKVIITPSSPFSSDSPAPSTPAIASSPPTFTPSSYSDQLFRADSTRIAAIVTSSSSPSSSTPLARSPTPVASCSALRSEEIFSPYILSPRSEATVLPSSSRTDVASSPISLSPFRSPSARPSESPTLTESSSPTDSLLFPPSYSYTPSSTSTSTSAAPAHLGHIVRSPLSITLVSLVSLALLLLLLLPLLLCLRRRRRRQGVLLRSGPGTPEVDREQGGRTGREQGEKMGREKEETAGSMELGPEAGWARRVRALVRGRGEGLARPVGMGSESGRTGRTRCEGEVRGGDWNWRYERENGVEGSGARVVNPSPFGEKRGTSDSQEAHHNVFLPLNPSPSARLTELPQRRSDQLPHDDAVDLRLASPSERRVAWKDSLVRARGAAMLYTRPRTAGDSPVVEERGRTASNPAPQLSSPSRDLPSPFLVPSSSPTHAFYTEEPTFSAPHPSLLTDSAYLSPPSTERAPTTPFSLYHRPDSHSLYSPTDLSSYAPTTTPSPPLASPKPEGDSTSQWGSAESGENEASDLESPHIPPPAFLLPPPTRLASKARTRLSSTFRAVAETQARRPSAVSSMYWTSHSANGSEDEVSSPDPTIRPSLGRLSSVSTMGSPGVSEASPVVEQGERRGSSESVGTFGRKAGSEGSEEERTRVLLTERASKSGQ